MKLTLKNISLWSFVAIGFLLIGAALGHSCSNVGTEDIELVKQLSDLREKHEGVVSVMNDEIDDLQALIDAQGEDLAVQADLILSLSDQPTKVEYVIKIVKIFEPVNVPQTVAVKDLPPEKFFGYKALDGSNIVTDRMESKDTDGDSIPDEVTFTPYAQKFVLDGTIAEKSSSFLLRITSEYDNIPHEVDLDVKVTKVTSAAEVKKHKLVDPGIFLSVGGFAGADILSRDPVVGYGGGLSLKWLHPAESVVILSPSVMIGSSWRQNTDQSAFIIRGGVSIVDYNLGAKPGGILRDTWVGADVGVGTDLGLSAGITLSSQL